jgi:hypothetical protein
MHPSLTTPEAFVDPRDITDAALAHLRTFALTRVCEAAPRLGEWIHHWCDREQFLRAQAERPFPTGHDLSIPNDLYSWPSGDVGAAALAAAMLTYDTHADLQLAAWLDRLALTLLVEAERRLQLFGQIEREQLCT